MVFQKEVCRDPHNFSALELQAYQSIPKTMTNHICIFSFLHTQIQLGLSLLSYRMGQTTIMAPFPHSLQQGHFQRENS